MGDVPQRGWVHSEGGSVGGYLSFLSCAVLGYNSFCGNMELTCLLADFGHFPQYWDLLFLLCSVRVSWKHKLWLAAVALEGDWRHSEEEVGRADIDKLTSWGPWPCTMPASDKHASGHALNSGPTSHARNQQMWQNSTYLVNAHTWCHPSMLANTDTRWQNAWMQRNRALGSAEEATRDSEVALQTAYRTCNWQATARQVSCIRHAPTKDSDALKVVDDALKAMDAGTATCCLSPLLIVGVFIPVAADSSCIYSCEPMGHREASDFHIGLDHTLLCPPAIFVNSRF